MESPFSSSSPLSNTPSRLPRPKVTAASFAALLPALVAAIIVGIVYHFVARFLDLLVIFPLAVGFIVGAILASLAEKNKVRSKMALGFLGIVCGLLCYGTREFADSLYDREQSLPALAAEMGSKNPRLVPVIEDRLRSMYPPVRYFPMYLEAAAEQGVSISSSHDFSNRSGNAPLTGWGFWGLFIAEGALITGTATAMAWGQANQLFCEPCDRWYGPQLTVTRLHPNQSDEALKMVQSGDYAALGNLRGEGADDKMHSDVLLTKCSGCNSGELELRTTRGKSVKTIWKSEPTPKEIATLEEVRAQWLK